jgi:cytochrome c oxidase subunit 2
MVFLPLLLFIALALTGCFDTDTPQNTFAPEGPVARDQREIFLWSMWPALVILILVEVALVVILLRFRRRRDDEVPKQTHGNTPLEIGWTILPALLLAALGIPMLIILFDIGREPKDDAFVVNVTGVQWLWLFEYPDVLDENGEPVTTSGELFLPTDKEIAINLVSEDVIHSFAIPRIAGTRDAIPSADLDGDGVLDHVERMWIRVDEPRSYYDEPQGETFYQGQCREFCGLGHANMKFKVYALDDGDFQRWAEEAAVSSNPEGEGDEVRAER